MPQSKSPNYLGPMGTDAGKVIWMRLCQLARD
jgi:hypothetical protein